MNWLAFGAAWLAILVIYLAVTGRYAGVWSAITRIPLVPATATIPDVRPGQPRS